MGAGPVRPARGAPRAALRARAEEVRAELARRGEPLPVGWEEEAARDLSEGPLTGVWLSPEDGAAGLAFFTVRGRRAYAHLHVDPGADRSARASALLDALAAGWTGLVDRADVGLSGLGEAEEAAWAGEAGRRLPAEVLVRHALERPLGPADRAAPALPPDARLRPLGELPVAGLAALDWRAFRGGPDERLVAETPEEARETFADLLDGRLGGVFAPASFGLVGSDGRLLGFVLVTTPLPGSAIVLDLAVEPTARRRGLGTLLLRLAFGGLATAGRTSVRLWVTEANAPARALYDRLGFRRVLTARILRWSAAGPRPSGPAEAT